MHAQRFARVFGLPRETGHIEQGTSLSAHILQKMPRGNNKHASRAALSRVSCACGSQDWWTAAKCFAYANTRGYEKRNAKRSKDSSALKSWTPETLWRTSGISSPCGSDKSSFGCPGRRSCKTRQCLCQTGPSAQSALRPSDLRLHLKSSRVNELNIP